MVNPKNHSCVTQILIGNNSMSTHAISMCNTSMKALIEEMELFCLSFFLETRLQSESFDTLDDLLGFQVQKL